MILVLNCGSQSIKWKVFDSNLKVAKEGRGKDLEEELAKIKGMEISLVGHRVVHGGGIFTKPAEMTDQAIAQLEAISHLAPLHNPYNILGIKTAKKVFENARQIAVFDTEFFADLPEEAFMYALPENLAKEMGFRRYGFHGTSHAYCAQQAAEKLKKPLNKLKIITCHLGGGASIAAVKNGKAIDTSMGFTPIEGLVMMTRPGNIDAGIVLEIAKKYSVEKADEILNKECGLKGICGSDQMLEILERIEQGDKKAQLALNIFVYSIKKYIGAYFAILQGCHALVFTGAIGDGSEKIRKMICSDLDILKKTKILAIEANEELAIAQKII